MKEKEPFMLGSNKWLCHLLYSLSERTTVSPCLKWKNKLKFREVFVVLIDFPKAQHSTPPSGVTPKYPENFQEKLKKFVDERLDSNGPSSKPYREISNSTREFRLEQDATGYGDRLLLNRHQTIHLIIKKAIQYRIDHNGSSMSINQMQKELKRTYFISTETIAYVLSQINSPEQDLFTIEANPPVLSTQQQQTDINKKNNKNDDSGDKNGGKSLNLKQKTGKIKTTTATDEQIKQKATTKCTRITRFIIKELHGGRKEKKRLTVI
ncbi:unnamed protein product [Didymodactylos carnosus]|uniref:Uncharacterized protein n=1 Tax=Didymodactylos carnosus TaxID=1234261 RepID=A0A815B616_9BILA|nr:unnamed protein product [Didymodactylos carnosus]CAF4048666.1 unnamed protein product [Didymodactylos carnosus]